MVQHFLLWRFTDEIRAGDTAPYLEQIADSVATLSQIPRYSAPGSGLCFPVENGTSFSASRCRILPRSRCIKTIRSIKPIKSAVKTGWSSAPPLMSKF